MILSVTYTIVQTSGPSSLGFAAWLVQEFRRGNFYSTYRTSPLRYSPSG